MKLVYSYIVFYETSVYSLYIAIVCFMKLVYSYSVFYETCI